MTRGDAESLTQRIRNAAAEEGIAIPRLRSRIAFQRMLARLAADGGWVLKGGFSLETRLGLRARATKDLDLLLRSPGLSNPIDLQDALDEALEADLGDGFTFRVRLPRQMRMEEAEPSTWRVVVEVRYADAEFGVVTVDVVTAADDRAGVDGAAPLQIEPVVVGEPFWVPALDPHRHAAEKFHAYARLYAYERPSSRVKDLIDLALFDESAMLDGERLYAALVEVFAERNTELPSRLPDPPSEWAVPFASLAAETGLKVVALDAARDLAHNLYERVRAHRTPTPEGTIP
ncbi:MULTISPECIES: nucleotidyl transferase AbiEii/AbiGii toxin family protein [unclassified Frigoribacterium]|uniref:nucleotidyl transferase AbiEii/AbiGii toxin family protein n=1 Tax=unclassified Frigoribacterium TaxID=2627005 RepID=UPI0006F4F0C9|nr:MULTISPECIES: nucleotidyl transferase AbiEii/AbiGii toxin family protein [unclassified Frigoribacterium]KQN39166.1 hypothetical protein ASE87_15255 [Frigoribacterium sp. Leaf44]